METRGLGTTGLISSAIGLGSAAFSGFYGAASEADCVNAVRCALDVGVTMFDAAGDYAGWEELAENRLGKALPGHRDNVLIATHIRRSSGYGRSAPAGDAYRLVLGCDESLRRLRTDYVDILYLPLRLGLPLAEGVGVLAGLVASGKARHIGLCEPSAEELRRAHAIHPVSVVAVEYSLQRIPDERLLAVARELGIGIVGCRPLGGGLLAGKTSVMASASDLAVLRACETEATALDLGTARLALAWLLARDDNVVPIPSSRSVTHVEMNASAMSVPLSADTRARLSRVSTAFRP